MDRESSLLAYRMNRRALLASATALAAFGPGVRASAHDKSPTPAASAAGKAEVSPVGSPAASPVITDPVFESLIQGLKFLPPEIHIEVGTTVVWTNEDVVAHTVTHKVKAEDQLFASPFLTTGQTFSYTFEEPGTYPIYCLPHPFMTQTVVVSEKPK